MDNLSSHKKAAVGRAIEDAGATLLFLPPYSSDLNPIEQVFAKLKKLDERRLFGPSMLSGRCSGPSPTACRHRNARTSSRWRISSQDEGAGADRIFC